MLNVRLDKDTEKKLIQYAEEHGISKTNVVKEALAIYLSRKEIEEHPFELGQDLFGIEASGQTDLSQTYKTKLKQKLNAKHTR